MSEDKVVDILQEWRSGGESLRWRSSTATNHGREVEIFHRRSGTRGTPALVCVHGFPTSSIDFFALTRELACSKDARPDGGLHPPYAR